MNSPGNPVSNVRQPHAPLALAALAFGIGIWLAGHLHRPAWAWALAAIGLMLCTVVSAARNCARLGYISVVSALICAGAFSLVWTPATHLNSPPEKFLSGAQVEIIGHVTNDGSMLAGSGPRERFDLETEEIRIGELIFTRPVGMRTTVFVKPSEEDQDEESQSG